MIWIKFFYLSLATLLFKPITLLDFNKSIMQIQIYFSIEKGSLSPFIKLVLFSSFYGNLLIDWVNILFNLGFVVYRTYFPDSTGITRFHSNSATIFYFGISITRWPVPSFSLFSFFVVYSSSLVCVCLFTFIGLTGSRWLDNSFCQLLFNEFRDNIIFQVIRTLIPSNRSK